jgi:diguanylate cyclase (GGDEF)-like protein
MSDKSSTRGSSEVVSLADRMRYMRFFRVALVAAVVAVAAAVPNIVGSTVARLAPVTAMYFVASIGGELLWRKAGRRWLWLFSALLIVDGVYLAWLSYVTGGVASPLRLLILVHLVTVALLASFRTGMKLALWHSMLLFVVFYAEQADILTRPAASHGLPGTEFQQVTLFMVIFWAIALTTSSFSAVNERELRRRRFDLEALARMAAELETASDSFEVADLAVGHVANAFDAERVVLVAAPDGAPRLMAGRGVDVQLAAEVPTGAGSVLMEAVSDRTTVLARELDAGADPGLAAILPDARNLVLVPLSAELRSMGVMVIEHGTKPGSRIERRVVSMLERFASHAALSLRNAWLLEQVQRLAATDGLTGIANRRTFEATLAREVFRASHKHEEMSLMMVDLDNFKQLNDAHGHQVGDHVLAEVAELLTRNCRDRDVPSRYGGEEFTVILPGCSVEESLATAERLRALIDDADMVIPITASIGVATFPLHGSDATELVHAADRALYMSKHAGRNCVTGAGTARAGAQPNARFDVEDEDVEDQDVEDQDVEDQDVDDDVLSSM